MSYRHQLVVWEVLPVIGSIARGTQRLIEPRHCPDISLAQIEWRPALVWRRSEKSAATWTERGALGRTSSTTAHMWGLVLQP